MRRQSWLWLVPLMLLAWMAAEAGSPELERARADKDAAFSRYTRLATEGGGDVEQALAEYRAAKARLEALQAAQAATPGPTAPSSPEAPADRPEAALARLLDAQAAGDAEATYASLASAHLAQGEREQLRAMLQSRAARFRFSGLQWRSEALGVQGDYALLRYSFRLLLAGEVPQVGGNLALLVREDGGWRVQQIVVDEPLTLAVRRRADPLTARAPAASAACSNPPPRRTLIDSEDFQRLASAAIHNWRADEGKLTRDLVYSAFGRIPLVGDVVSSAYTAMERLHTLAVELPADVRAGDVKTSFLDLSLIAWGGVQFVAEVLPGFDNLSDAGETYLQSTRDEMARQRAYWELLRALQQGSYLQAPKYLFLRALSADSAALWNASLHYRQAPGWHGRGHPLLRLDVLDDALLRRDSRLLFAVGVELAIRRSDNETHFELARHLGFPVVRVGAFDDAVVHVGLDVSRRAQGDASSGDAVLDRLRAPAAFAYLGYRVDCRRGEQKLEWLMDDGGRTEPLLFSNLVFNLIEGVQAEDDAGVSDHLALLVDERRSGLRVGMRLREPPPGLEVRPPQVLGRNCVSTRVRAPEIVAVRTEGRWPDATLALAGKAAGTAAIEFHWPATRALPALDLELPVQVAAATPALGLDGAWTLTLVLADSTRPATGAPRTEAERRAARDSLSLTAPGPPPFGESASLRVRIVGGLLQLWETRQSQWVEFASLSASADGARWQLQLSAGDEAGTALAGTLIGDARALAGEIEVREDGQLDRYRARLER